MPHELLSASAGPQRCKSGSGHRPSCDGRGIAELNCQAHQVVRLGKLASYLGPWDCPETIWHSSPTTDSASDRVASSTSCRRHFAQRFPERAHKIFLVLSDWHQSFVSEALTHFSLELYPLRSEVA